ncbi:MAG: hypothetical protein ACOY3N_09415 [Bradyrhizobium sp.]|uniref:hypothetical protein n=1 Tax=Bradyrhizobium sp. TaxID=376 RepID=UPI003BF1298F
MLGFDAIGRLALGQITPGNIALSAVSGSFTLSGIAATFALSEAATAGAFTISAPSISQEHGVGIGSFTLSGAAQTFDLTENVEASAYVITGSIANNIDGVSDPGSFVITGVDQWLYRTGDDYEFKLGGVGHFLEEIERQKRLNAITRKIPAPVDRRTVPRFAPLPAVQPMPTAPVVDMAAVEQQRQADAARAAAARRRRDEEAVLLLAS